MLGGGAVEVAVHGDPPQVEVQVVLPGDADAAVELRALLHQLGGVVAEVRRRRAHDLGRVGIGVLHDAGGELGDAVRGLQPHLHVGEPVLDRLVRRQRPAERAAVGEVLERELDDPVERANGLRALQHDGELQLPFDGRRRGVDVADDVRRGHAHAVEAHRGEAADEVGGVERLDRDAGRAGAARGTG